MIDKLKYIQDGKTRYPMAFTFNIMESVETEYGSLGAWIKKIQKEEPSYKAIKFMLFEVINEGLEIEGSDKQLSLKETGRLITRVGFEEVGLKLFELIKESFPGKNTLPMQKKKPTKN